MQERKRRVDERRRIFAESRARAMLITETKLRIREERRKRFEEQVRLKYEVRNRAIVEAEEKAKAHVEHRLKIVEEKQQIRAERIMERTLARAQTA